MRNENNYFLKKLKEISKFNNLKIFKKKEKSIMKIKNKNA